MYLAGTPYTDGVPSQPCTGQDHGATTCGLLTIFDLSSMSIVNATPIVITDGYHNRIAMGANGQLFIGARTCTEIIPPLPPPPGAEIRGCLSIYNTLTTPVGNALPGGVLIPPENGDATGLQPIAKRTVVYIDSGRIALDLRCHHRRSGIQSQRSVFSGRDFWACRLLYDVKTVDF